MDQLRRLDHIKQVTVLSYSLSSSSSLPSSLLQGQFTATVTDEEEAMPPRFMTNIQDAEVRIAPSAAASCRRLQVFVAEGEPAMFECRVEPKHDLNLAVRWYRNDEELVSPPLVLDVVLVTSGRVLTS